MRYSLQERFKAEEIYSYIPNVPTRQFRDFMNDKSNLFCRSDQAKIEYYIMTDWWFLGS